MLFQYPYYQPTGAGRGVFQVLVDWGILDALLPFILIWVLIFAILQKIALFKDENGEKPNKRINAVIGLIIGAMVVIPHVTRMYPPHADPILIIGQFLPGASVILIAVLLVTILLGFVSDIPNLALWAIALVALGFLLFTIMVAIIPGWFPTFSLLREPEIQAMIVAGLTMGLIVYFLFREPTGGESGEWIKKWFGETR